MVNLIDKKGSQKKVGDSFTRCFKELKDPDIKYVWFDFHGECKKMKWENLSKLIDIVKEELQNYGYFSAELNFAYDSRPDFNNSKNSRIINKQVGAFRTNCMDCLDRTNVV